MIYDIVISYQAEIDLRGIFEYIAFELKSPENASGQLDRLEACILSCSIYSDDDTNLFFYAHFYGRRYRPWLTELWVLLSRLAKIPPNHRLASCIIQSVGKIKIIFHQRFIKGV